MNTLGLMLGLIRDLIVVWSPYVATILVIAFVVLLGNKMQRTARANARIRAERRLRNAHRAQVIDITAHLPAPNTEGNIA